MEFTLEAGELANALGLVKGVVPSRTTIPILSNVVLDTSSGQLSITGSCLDMEASVTVPCEVIAHGKTTVQGHVLFGLAKALPKTKLATIKVDGARAILTCGKSRYDLGTLDAADFPILDVIRGDDAVSFSMPASELKSALDATRSMVSSDETRHYLQGVHFAIENGKLAFAATDGHRLCRIISQTAIGASAWPHIIVPSAAVAQIVNILGSSGNAVAVTVDARKIEVTIGSVRLVSRLIEGQYPDYGRVIPRYNSEANFTATASEISDAVDRLAMVASGGSILNPAVKVATNGTAIDVSMSGLNQGSETIDATIGAKTEFGVSVRYLSEMVGLWPSASALDFTAPDMGSPILITSKDLPNQTHVIMPMRVHNNG